MDEFRELEKRHPKIAQYAVKGSNYVKDAEPRDAASNLRIFAEALARQIADIRGIDCETIERQQVLIDLLEGQGIIASDVAGRFHEIRRIGNRAAHFDGGRPLSIAEARRAERAAGLIARWYLQGFKESTEERKRTRAEDVAEKAREQRRERRKSTDTGERLRFGSKGRLGGRKTSTEEHHGFSGDCSASATGGGSFASDPGYGTGQYETGDPPQPTGTSPRKRSGLGAVSLLALFLFVAGGFALGLDEFPFRAALNRPDNAVAEKDPVAAPAKPPFQLAGTILYVDKEFNSPFLVGRSTGGVMPKLGSRVFIQKNGRQYEFRVERQDGTRFSALPLGPFPYAVAAGDGVYVVTGK